MPIINGKYKNPGWVNDQRPAIDAGELNAIGETLEHLGGDRVTSFNGRAGAVVPQAGDYTAAQVGAATMGQVNDAIQAAVSSIPAGVTSFKGRTGAITPQSGDYTAAQVGARPANWTPITYGTADLTDGVSSLETGMVYLVYSSVATGG